MTYGSRYQRAHVLSYKPYKTSKLQIAGKIISTALTYALIIWYIAEITGNGRALRSALASAAQWSKYGIAYAMWYTRKEML